MIETNRLVIKPLTLRQLKKYVCLDNSLEADLGVNSSSRTISGELREALEKVIIPGVSDPAKNYLFSTLWTIISREENALVGDLCFAGEPNSEGEIEIGYGTHEGFRRKGFMTEAVGGMVGWARSQNNVKTIVASTEKSNCDSSSVLERNNFCKCGETATLYNWRLELV